jgi:hypothetical protein
VYGTAAGLSHPRSWQVVGLVVIVRVPLRLGWSG